jgi:hypothetical protein
MRKAFLLARGSTTSYQTADLNFLPATDLLIQALLNFLFAGAVDLVLAFALVAHESLLGEW